MDLPDGALVEVDGYKGLIYLREGRELEQAIKE
jgi:hypothetical protein